MKTIIKTAVAVTLCALAASTVKGQTTSGSSDRQVVSFVEHFTSFDGAKGSLEGDVVLAGTYNDKGTRHEDFVVTGANKDGSEVYISITGTITASQGTLSLLACGTIHFVSGQIAYVEGSESITGGTGAYVDARGKGSFIASQDMAGDPNQIVGTFKIGASPVGHFTNISTRAFVEAGEKVEIGGFILRSGNGLTPVVVRALGPSLAAKGVVMPLQDPTIDLRDKDGARLAFNDNWKDDPSQASEISNVGLAPTNEREAAIFALLPAGEYTAIVTDKNGTFGTAIVELYNLSD